MVLAGLVGVIFVGLVIAVSTRALKLAVEDEKRLQRDKLNGDNWRLFPLLSLKVNHPLYVITDECCPGSVEGKIIRVIRAKKKWSRAEHIGFGKIMDETQAAASGRAESGWADVAIRFALAALIVYWSFLLLRPFIAILIWAAILSVALYPIFLWLKRVLGGRSFVDPKELEGAVASSNQLGRSKPRGWQAMTTWPP